MGRIDEIVELLEGYALGELHIPKARVKAALRLLDLAIEDEPPPDDGDEAPISADDQAVLAFSRKLAA